jgi:DNA invertase Pin-like site-specific DNA recombinase
MKCAIYARYSTDLQREQSIADQFRVAERIAERHGFTVAAKFADQAISGGTSQRPGYQKMLAAARRHEFEAIVAEDTSRLWRNLAEQSPRLAELSDLGIAVVTHDLDTRHESAEIMGAVGGAMAAAYRKEIGRRVRRGLEGLARNGKSAGGRSYGYTPATQSHTGQIEIDPEQSAVVVRIFEMYAAGYGPRAIAETLNRERVPSPGSRWERESRRKAGWVASAIHGNPARGLGILNNDAYRGVVVWNRSRWIRSAADSSRRRQVQNPKSEWIVRQDERLRIVSDELWRRVKARQADQTHRIGERVKIGMTKAQAIRTGAGPKFLLSSILRCAECGSSLAIAGRDVYCCSGHTNGGASLCGNDALLHRERAEFEVLKGIKRELRSPAVIKEICRRARTALSASKPEVPDNAARIAQLKAEIGNIADAIAGGVLRASPTLAARLADAEAEFERLQAADQEAAAPQPDITKLIADLPKRARRAVDRLEETLAAGDLTRARQEIKDHVGVVTMEADEREIRLYSEQGQIAAAMLRAVGSHASLCGSGGPLRSQKSLISLR